MHGDDLDPEDEAADSCAESLDVEDVEDEDGADDEEEDELDSLLLDEDSNAPNLVPEVEPRGILAGRIELLDKIGEGGMGAVWRGHHLKLGRAVAVKVLDETLQLRVDGRERFIREAQSLALLEHRNIVRIYDCDQDPDGKLYLCMELLEGETLRELIKRGPPLDPLEVIEVGLQVCDAVEAAHKQGILHRDLTPSNIIRLRDPGKTIKVIDWGLCKYLDLFYVRTTQKYAAPPGSRLVTPFGCRFGTPDYMAPEMMRREDPGPPSFCTDVYALSVVLYELLTGRHPFARGDRKKPLPVRSLLPDFEYQDLETALRAALRFDPGERTQTMPELREALDLARECLLAQREPISSGDQAAPVAALEPVFLPAAPERPVAQLAEVAACTCEALSGPMPAAPARPVAQLAGVAARTCEALPRPMPAAPAQPRGRLAIAALSLLLGVGVGVGGTVTAQHFGGSSVPPADAPSPALAASLALETARASAGELRAERCETEAANQSLPPEPALSLLPATPNRPGAKTSPGTAIRPVVLAATDPGPTRPQARPPRPTPAAQTFQEAMTQLEPRLRGCARKTNVPERETTVQIRHKGGEIGTVRVLNLSKDHPFSICVDQLVRKTIFPPGARPIEEVTFFK